jgi:hypothetical protein
MSETPDWAKKEVQEAVRILKSDGIHIHKTYDAFMASKKVNSEAETGEKLAEGGEKLSGDNPEGNPPPEKKEDEKNEKPKKKGMWWGDRDE